jgi:hypothetical protein
MTWSGLPVTISFVGQAFSEGQVLAYGYDFEQATKARVLPSTHPRYRAMCWDGCSPENAVSMRLDANVLAP